jgi:N-methylhydantoinase A/oxoprolinase/acetone carboxylase beta subunit
VRLRRSPLLSRRRRLTPLTRLADRKGGPLALTDANLVLGRILPDFFPKVFGPNENEALDPQASLDAFQSLEKRIRAESAFEGSIDELVYGFVTGPSARGAARIRRCSLLTIRRHFHSGE